MRTKLSCLFAAALVVGCGGGANEAAAPPPANAPGAQANPVECQTAEPVGTVNAAGTPRLVGNLRFNITVTATNSRGNQGDLRFLFKSTDGIIETQSPTSNTAVWRAPPGPGLHFVYVLVSNGKGGYTQRRIVISTEGIGGNAPVNAPRAYAPPPAPAPNCFTFRSFVRTGELYGRGSSDGNVNGQFVGGDSILMPDVDIVGLETVSADPNNPAPPRPLAKTDLRGSFQLNYVPQGDFARSDVGNTTVQGILPSGNEGIQQIRVEHQNAESTNDVFGQRLTNAAEVITGRVLLADDADPATNSNAVACGVVSEFFDKAVSGTVELLDATGNILATRRMNYQGHYAFPRGVGASTATQVRIRCEGAATRVIAANTNAPRTVLTDTSAPEILNMQAQLQGSTASFFQAFLPTLSGGKSDIIPDDQFFLDYKGIDTALSACMYYRSIGAVQNCGPKGELINPINFDDWQAKNRIGRFLPAGAVQPRAKFINRVDLNLGRDHIAVSHTPGEAATCVSNYLGANNDLDSAIRNDPELARAAIDAAVAGMDREENLVARVCMDHTSHGPNVNGGKAFTNFLIFGPSGELLTNINLDGRTEKYVPGTCVICHGGDRYAGKFPEDGTGLPDIGTHLLPFIVPNFNFSSVAPLRRQDQEDEIKALNFIIRDAGLTAAGREAINGWYNNGQRNTFDDNFIPASWRNRSQADRDFYQQVYKADCLGCHINGPERLNFDRRENLLRNVGGREEISANVDITSCGDGRTRSAASNRNLPMPNALRTFDLYWGSQGLGAIDKPAIMSRFINQYSDVVQNCNLTQTPIR